MLIDVVGFDCLIERGRIGETKKRRECFHFSKKVDVLACALRAIRKAEDDGYCCWWYSSERYTLRRKTVSEIAPVPTSTRSKRLKRCDGFQLEDLRGCSFEHMLQEVRDAEAKSSDDENGEWVPLNLHSQQQNMLVELQCSDRGNTYISDEDLEEWAAERAAQGFPMSTEDPFRSASAKRVTLSQCGIAVIEGEWDSVTKEEFAELVPHLQRASETVEVMGRFYHGLGGSEASYPIVPVLLRGNEFPWSAWFQSNVICNQFDFNNYSWRILDDVYIEGLIGSDPRDEDREMIQEAMYEELQSALEQWQSSKSSGWNSQCPERELLNPNPVVVLGGKTIKFGGSNGLQLGFITAAVWT